MNDTTVSLAGHERAAIVVHLHTNTAGEIIPPAAPAAHPEPTAIEEAEGH